MAALVRLHAFSLFVRLPQASGIACVAAWIHIVSGLSYRVPMHACMQAALQSSTQPLASVLAAERLPHHLSDLLLYGIAMARTAQPDEAARGGPDGAAGAGSGAVLSARDGADAVRLYAQSMNRFTSGSGSSAAAGGGAFMAPSYGCGSLAEVRACMHPRALHAFLVEMIVHDRVTAAPCAWAHGLLSRSTPELFIAHAA